MSRLRVAAGLVAVAGMLAACGTGSAAPVVTSPPAVGKRTVSVTVDGRPFLLRVPAAYRPGSPAPLVIALHGYQWTAAQFERYVQLTPESDRRGFLYAMPDGTEDTSGYRFWSATDACCNLYGSTVDDSTYLSHLITALANQYTVDRRRVFLVGHSNGAFMAYRMACDHADQIAAIVALNGAMWSDASRCRPSRPVSVLDVHGVADQTIAFEGGTGAAPYPSAATTVADWVAFDHCAGTADLTAAPLDLTTDVVGAETAVTSYHVGCAGGASVVAWAIDRGSHIPSLGPAFTPAIVDFLSAHSSG